ncbi:hypothetical protein GY45DRAFT_1326336 [Cubamyces sp. BRFM 1775]|nr:hypothetical protein GY45DRAFT_1326336 [Cubamyces sp. BRFM 1775]
MSDSSLVFASRLCLFICLAFWSYILDRPLGGQRLRIRRLSASGAHGIRYEGALYNKSYAFTYTASSITWRLHLPRRDDPRWLTVTVNDVLYISSTGDISTSKLETILWFFPVLFRFTSGPWANVTIDGLRIRVHKSTATPYWIQRLRENLVGTFLTGEFLRADVFRTAIRFAGFSEHEENKPAAYTDPKAKLSPEEPIASDEDEPCGCCSPASRTNSKSNGYTTYTHQEEADALAHADENKTGPLRAIDDDELRFSVIARGVHINNMEGRMYTFGRIDSQMRRNWAKDRGSFAMVAEECRWVHVHFPFERVAPRAWLTQLVSSLWHFPIDLVRTFNNPASSVNLYVTRVDVTFDSFRLRDAELVRQGFALVREKAITSKIDWSDVFFDALLDAFATRPAPPVRFHKTDRLYD